MSLPHLPKPTHPVLVVAHPGHELRVHGWLEQARPLVLVLTDGSGRSNRSRLDSTTTVLARAGARPGTIYGRLSDSSLYAAILRSDADPIIELVEEFAEVLSAAHVDFVVGDALEGYNPAHDLCRVILNAAVELVELREERRIANYDFSLVGPPRGLGGMASPSLIRLQLDDAALARKLATARDYREMAAEVDAALRQHGEEAFRHEYFRPADRRIVPCLLERPYYEVHGEEQVAAGHYQRVLRDREHVQPLAESIQRYVRGVGHRARAAQVGIPCSG